MKLITIGVGDSFSMRISCPRPPRNFPAPPEPGIIRFSWKKSGLLRSAISTGVDEMLLGTKVHARVLRPGLQALDTRIVAPAPPRLRTLFTALDAATDSLIEEARLAA